jgi:DNA-binding MarR family transcriptional regulator
MNKHDPGLAPRSLMIKEASCFREAGFSAKGADAIVRIDTTMARIRRAMLRREMVVNILAEIDPSLDLQKLDVMGAVASWMPEEGADPNAEVTVGTVAQRLGIDPSRASRLIADVVELGYIRRVASQQDSRRIVLEPTEKGIAFGDRFRQRKAELLSKGLEGWTEQELVTFARLVERFSTWWKQAAPAAQDAAE